MLFSGLCINTLTGHTNWLFAMTLLPNGLIASGGSDKTIKIWDISKTYPLYTLTGHSSVIRGLVVVNNQFIASCSEDLSIKFWSLNGYVNVQTWTASTAAIIPLAYDPTLNMLANGDNANQVSLWSSDIWTTASKTMSKFLLATFIIIHVIRKGNDNEYKSVKSKRNKKNKLIYYEISSFHHFFLLLKQ